MRSWRRAACSNARLMAARLRGLRLTLWQPLVYIDSAFVGTPTARARA
jgi:hypothetical protein